ncbi:unnamed protein product [Notodromas monacha]|uniref:Uncharacterized protein n=1 Tax=Notodromas monacha TaxID=399045 RepID=A0A7R9BGE0_9CRUS|nr:unnamed protein product [Notodromas monacha]CAG0914970.1 unnamed protein product [Notodromas monacha]
MDAPASSDDRTPKEKVQFYVSAALLISAIFSLSAFLFLIPFVLDPAYTLIAAKFIKEPVTCQVTEVETLFGLSNCTWSSCREGCTREVTECTRISVRYTSKLSEKQITENTDDAAWESDGARFFINVKGCGYPPTVNCSLFASYYGTEGEVFPCFFSSVNPQLVIPEYDLEQAHSDMVFATVFPVTIFTVGVTGLCLMYIRVCRERALAVLNSTGFNLIHFLDSLEQKPEPEEDDDRSEEEDEGPVQHVPNQNLAPNPNAFPGAHKYGHGARRNQDGMKRLEGGKNATSKALINSIHAPIVGGGVGGDAMTAAGESNGNKSKGPKPKKCKLKPWSETDLLLKTGFSQIFGHIRHLHQVYTCHCWIHYLETHENLLMLILVSGFFVEEPLKPFFEKHFPISPDWAVIPYYGGQFIFGWIGSLRRDCSRVIVLASFLGILGSALQTSATLKAFSRIATWLYTVGSVLCAVSFGGGFHGCLVCTLVLNKASVDRRIGLRSKDEKPRFQDMRFLKHVAFVHLVYFLGKLVWGVIVGWTHLDRWCSGSQNCFTIVHLWKMCNHAIPAAMRALGMQQPLKEIALICCLSVIGLLTIALNTYNVLDLYVVSSHVVESGNKSTVTGWMTSYILWTTFRTMFVVILIEFSVCEVPRKLRGLAFVMAQMPPLVANTFKYLAKMYVNSSGIPTPEFLLWASAANASAILLLLWMSRIIVLASIFGITGSVLQTLASVLTYGDLIAKSFVDRRIGLNSVDEKPNFQEMRFAKNVAAVYVAFLVGDPLFGGILGWTDFGRGCSGSKSCFTMFHLWKVVFIAIPGGPHSNKPGSVYLNVATHSVKAFISVRVRRLPAEEKLPLFDNAAAMGHQPATIQTCKTLVSFLITLPVFGFAGLLFSGRSLIDRQQLWMNTTLNHQITLSNHEFFESFFFVASFMLLMLGLLPVLRAFNLKQPLKEIALCCFLSVIGLVAILYDVSRLLQRVHGGDSSLGNQDDRVVFINGLDCHVTLVPEGLDEIILLPGGTTARDFDPGDYVFRAFAGSCPSFSSVQTTAKGWSKAHTVTFLPNTRSLIDRQQLWMNTTLNHQITLSNHEFFESFFFVASFMLLMLGLLPVLRAFNLKQPLKEIALCCFLSVIGLVAILYDVSRLLQRVHGGDSSLGNQDDRVVFINGLDCHVTLVPEGLDEIILLPGGTTARDFDPGDYVFRAFAGSCPSFSSVQTTAKGWSKAHTVTFLPNTIHTLLVFKGTGNSVRLRVLEGIKNERFKYPILILNVPEDGSEMPEGTLVHLWTGTEVLNFTKNFMMYEGGVECAQHCELPEDFVLESCYQCELDHSGWYILKVKGANRNLMIGMYSGGRYDISVQRSDSNDPKELFVVSSRVVGAASEVSVTGWMFCYILWVTFRTLFISLLLEFAVCEVPRRLRGLAMALTQISLLLTHSYTVMSKRKQFLHPAGISTIEFLTGATYVNLIAVLGLWWLSRSFHYYGIRIVADKYVTVNKYE